MSGNENAWRGYLTFGVLCVLVASRWIAEEAAPELASTLSSQSLGCLLAAGFWGSGVVFHAVRQEQKIHLGLKTFSLRALGLTLALTGPALGEAAAGHHLGAGAVSIALVITSTMVALGSAVTSETGNFDLVGAMWPGLAALAGLLLLLPQPSFLHWRMWLGWAIMPLVTGFGAVLSQLLGKADTSKDCQNSWVRPIALLLSAGLFGVLSLGSHVRVSWSLLSAGLDGVTIVVSLSALSQLGPLPWSAQFALIPLLGFGEGMILLRPAVDARSWAGLGLIAVGVCRLLFGSQGSEGTALG